MRVEVDVDKKAVPPLELLAITIKVTADDGKTFTYEYATFRTDFLSVFEVVMEEATEAVKRYMLEED